LLLSYPQKTIIVWVYSQKWVSLKKYPQEIEKGLGLPIYEIKPFFFGHQVSKTQSNHWTKFEADGDYLIQVELGISSKQTWNLSGIQFTMHFIEFFVVETKQFVSSTVNVILRRQTCGQRSSRAADSESKCQALWNYFSVWICYMFLLSKYRGDWDLGLYTLWVLAKREPLYNDDFWLLPQTKSEFWQAPSSSTILYQLPATLHNLVSKNSGLSTNLKILRLLWEKLGPGDFQMIVLSRSFRIWVIGLLQEGYQKSIS